MSYAGEILERRVRDWSTAFWVRVDDADRVGHALGEALERRGLRYSVGIHAPDRLTVIIISQRSSTTVLGHRRTLFVGWLEPTTNTHDDSEHDWRELGEALFEVTGRNPNELIVDRGLGEPVHGST